jgi:hypothetical protein
MVPEQLTEEVLGRFKELGLPTSLMELDEFREHFFQHQWVMYVHDRDAVANVHLFQPRHVMRSAGRR